MSAFQRTMLWDWRLLFRQRIGWMVLALTLALSLLAVWNGARFTAQWNMQATAATADSRQARERLLGDIASGDTWSALSFSAEGTIILPPAPLSSIATGRADLDPRIAKAGTFTKRHQLFQHYEVDSPLALALGRFDLAFVVQTLLPLLVIALGYGLFAEERERGLDRVLEVQGVPLRRLLLARLLARALLVLMPLLLVLVLAGALCGAVTGSPANMQRFALAVALITGYLAFWWALVAWVATWKLGEGQTLLVLLAAWMLLVLALPALSGLVSRELHPPPSRFELIAAARAQEIEGVKRGAALLGDYAHDHPDLDPGASVDLPAWAGNLFLTSRLVDETVAPVVQRFDDALAAQQASVERWQYATPALMLQRGLIAAAGTDERRRAAFLLQARDYLVDFRERTGRMMLQGQRLDANALDSLPDFSFIEPTTHDIWRSVSRQLLTLWVLSIALLLLALMRTRKA